MTTEELIQRAIDEYASITGAPDGRSTQVPTLARYIALTLAETVSRGRNRRDEQ